MTLLPDATPRQRVLVVEDSELLRTLITTMLSRAGYDVVALEDGRAAVEMASANIDVVLLDLGLPGTSGLDVCRRLRAEPATAHLPVIILTGRSHPDDVRDGLRAGADDFLVKPFELDALLEALVRLRRHHRLP